MEYKEAIYWLRPHAILVMKIFVEAIVRTAIFFMFFIMILIVLNLDTERYYLTYLGFIIGSLIANISYVFNKRNITQHRSEEVTL